MYQVNKAEKTVIEEQLAELQRQQMSFDELEQEIQRIKDKIEAIKQIKDLDRTVIDNFIDRIIVAVDGNITIIMKFGTIFDVFTQTQVMLTYDDSEGFKEIPLNNIKFIKTMEDFKKVMPSYRSVRCLNRT